MKIDSIREDVLEDVQARGFSNEEIEKMSAKKVFEEYCQWNGLIGFGYGLWEIVLDLQQASLREE